MLINGISLDTLGIKLYDRVINSNTVDTTHEWLDGDIQPTYVRQQDRFKNIKLSFLVLGTDEDDAFVKISKLTQLIKKATLVFDDISFSFDVAMRGEARTERLKNGNFIVTYELDSDYAKGQREVYTTDAIATSVFKLTVIYYQNQTTLLGTEVYTIRAGSFNGQGDTLTSIGIDVDKYKNEYYSSGVATNLGNMVLTYENLQALNTLIINYAPIKYNLTIGYWIDSGNGYAPTLENTITFTYPQVEKANSIGQIVDAAIYKPDGYKATIDYYGDLTVEDILAASPIQVRYDKIENPQSKHITIVYRSENDDEEYDVINTRVLNVDETSIVEGMTLQDIIALDDYNPNELHYQNGVIEGHAADELIVYDQLEVTYNVDYRLRDSVVYVEYYAGTYPDWYRLAIIPMHFKYHASYEDNFDIDKIGLNLNRYHTSEYQSGVLYNASVYTDYDSLVSAGVLQVYYVPIDYSLTVRYYTDEDSYTDEVVTINALQFFNNPVISDLIDLSLHRPEGYQFDLAHSYHGDVTLSNLLLAAPIEIRYEEIQVVRTKNIIVRYKQQLASAYSVINTSLLTIREADVVGGIRLKDLINLNSYRPSYYDSGFINGVSATALTTYDEIESSYDVLYNATEYTTPVYYYTDEVNELNWVGSDVITYRVIDFTVDTTLYDLGLNVNQYKTAYTGNGEIQYNGPINFTSLRGLSSIDIVYMTMEEPEDPTGIDYPHRILFLQHNDLGNYETEHPEWTMNHAYINTGVSALDMSQLTVAVNCYRVDELVPLYTVNAGYGYLFGSSSPLGQFYMRYNNQTMYGTNLSGINMYEAKAGNTVNPLMQTEEQARGWNEYSGIYSSTNEGYSRAVFTHSQALPTEHAQMPYPLYLFANNNNGSYADGLAGIGIKSCKIWNGDQLIRDFIPVQTYDLIGTQVAPSNCLYDKVSQTFFEDATGLNSFNIMDDDSYPDNNLVHKIGSCYIHYYKDGVYFQTQQLWFRGNDFEEPWDIYKKLMVDDYQPAYYKAGIITNLSEIAAINFDNLNGFVFNVNYEALTNIFEVNYYKDSVSPENLIATDRIGIEERDFYQVPSFGDIVRLNKYRPDGYQTNFQYPGARVSLQRIMDNAPYNIVYTPIVGEEETYSTTIRYIKRVWGLHTYETLGTITLTLGASQFRDGEYIEYFINYNLMKPEKYYGDGAPYEWYEHDLRLDTPDNLQDEYVIYYQPTPQNVEVRYYTDDIDEANLIATTNWTISITDFDGPFYLVDQLPNIFINKFKPVNADGGILQNSDVLYTFDDLMDYGHIDILYMSVAEPDDPTNASRLGKVLYWTQSDCPSSLVYHVTNSRGVGYYMMNGGCIPYIDLGYTPKEIGRLKVELKGYFQSSGFQTDTTPYGFQSPDYTYGFGYYGALGAPILDHHQSMNETLKKSSDLRYNEYYPSESYTSKGVFAIRGHIPQAKAGVYTDVGLVGLDGEPWYRTNNQNAGTQGATLTSVTDLYDGQPKYAAMSGIYRKGFSEDTDDNYNYFRAYKDYQYTRSIKYGSYVSKKAVVNDTTGEYHLGFNKWVADPITYTLDAYHSYASAYDFGDSNDLTYVHFDESGDTDTFENRCKPVGSLTLFRTRNPDTGKMNIMPFMPLTYPNVSGGIGIVGFSQSDIQTMMNPFSGEWTGQVTYIIGRSGASTTQSGVTNTNQGLEITNPYENMDSSSITNTGFNVIRITRDVMYGDFPCPVYPQQSFAAIWGIKIWDQDRLVRDMIPVKAGERIFDYVMPEDGLFDLVTEIFFGNSNEGGTYTENYYLSDRAGSGGMVNQSITIRPQDVCPLHTADDPCYWGTITENYYDENNHFIANQYVHVPTWFYEGNTTLEDELQYNDYKPDDYHLNGILDTDNPDDGHTHWGLEEIYNQGTINIYYKLRTFAKSVVYYKDDYRVGTQDLFFSLADIENASSLADLNINLNRYADSKFKSGRFVFDESILQNNDVAGFIDAPSPVVVYDKYTKAERPDLLYLEFYRGGAYDDPEAQIELDPNSNNYLICNLPAKVLNPSGAIKYRNHYHSAMYEDEDPGYFIPYQVRVINPYTGIHYGPARKYKTLAEIAARDTYTIEEVRNGWGRLREYYHGWIMLSATEPLTGPGLNPDYDSPTDATATIPFGESILINKLTVDRLWAYVPLEQSWVKTEEISFDQAGKLYNALDITVIDLNNDVNWTTANSLADVGIYPNNRRLQYHDFCDYTYAGEYTKEAFSDIHSLDFVYPETVYNYACIYYQNQKKAENELGRAAFSCTISDWNPDWDHFIETSWRYDDDNNLILPELYREAPISLTWDYFGFNKNLFKPDGYYDGIYLWNPHPWDEEHLFFSFEELVRVGTQYVVYPFINPHTYKYWDQLTTLGDYANGNNRYYGSTRYLDLVVETEDTMINTVTTRYKDQTKMTNLKVPQPAGVTYQFSGMSSDTIKNIALRDGYYADTVGDMPYYYLGSSGGSIRFFEDVLQQYLDTHPAFAASTSNVEPIQRYTEKIYNAGLNGFMTFEQPARRRFYFSQTSPYSSLYVASVPYHNEFVPKYTLKAAAGVIGNEAYSELPNGLIRIQPKHVSFYKQANNPNRVTEVTNTILNSQGVVPNISGGVYHGIRTYVNNELQNYFIPVPKGMWYEWNGVRQQFPENGLFDIMTGGLLYRPNGNGQVFEYDFRTTVGENPSDHVFSIFTGWVYQEHQMHNQVYKLLKANTGYMHPDLLSAPIRNLQKGLCVPVDKSTDDTASDVSGLWYHSGDQWLRANPDENETGERVEAITMEPIIKEKQPFVILPDRHNTDDTSLRHYHKWLNPTAAYTSSHNIYSSTIPVERVSYFTFDAGDHRYVFDGEYWYDWDETSLAITYDAQMLALSVNSLDFYSLPIATDEYKIGQYLAGDRVYMLGHSAREWNWGLSDEGWFRIDRNFSGVEMVDPNQPIVPGQPDEDAYDANGYSYATDEFGVPLYYREIDPLYNETYIYQLVYNYNDGYYYYTDHNGNEIQTNYTRE